MPISPFSVPTYGKGSPLFSVLTFGSGYPLFFCPYLKVRVSLLGLTWNGCFNVMVSIAAYIFIIRKA